jgi:8-oxo-dGTP pyrophosphatase MutT (NUDIX family)
MSLNLDIRMSNPAGIDVVTAFLEFDGQILILRRSKRVKTMKEKWGAVSGYIENRDPLSQAIIEVYEETGLDSSTIKLMRSGDLLAVIYPENPDITYNVHPFLFQSKSGKVILSREHDQFKWITMKELWKYNTVPKLKEAYENVTDLLHSR